MLSKQLQIIISLMFVTIMFVQTPAIAGNNVASIQFGPKANSNDYQSGSQFLPEKSSSAKQIDTNNVENIAKITTNTNSIVAYNSSGTVVVANSSYVNPGQYINLSLNSSAFSNFYYNNAFTYSLSDPMGNQPYSNSTNTPLVNNTQNTVNLNPTWSSQSLNGQISYKATSYSKIYGVSINNPIPQSYSPTIERITWKTNGNTTSRIIYDTSNTLSSSDSNYNDKSIDGFRNSHSMFLTNLLPNTTYYYRIYGTDYFGRTINSTLLSFTTATVATGYPYITSAITLTVTNTTATLGYTPSVASNYILTYSTTRLGVTNGVPLTLNN